jgi:hypothetical protein
MPSVPPSTGGHAERRAFPRDRRSVGDPLRPAASWGSFAAAQPELAARIRQRFSAHTHLTMATVRADGTPRISGNEVRFRAGVLYLAGLVGARRFADLRGRPGVAIHSGSDDADTWTGDAKLTGLAREVTDLAERAAFAGSLSQEPPAWTFELFAVDILDATTIELTPEKDALLITTWSPLHGTRVFRR